MLIDPDFLDHWKTRMLVDLLDGDELAPIYVIRIWGHCQNRRQTQLKPMPDVGLKSVCRYDGNAEKLVDSLVESGFILRDGDDGFSVPGFHEHNSNLFNSWKNGKKGGRPKKTHGIPTDNPRRTPLEEKRIEEKIIEEKTEGETPLPPFDVSTVEIPEKLNTPEFLESWAAWQKFRIEKRQKLTKSSVSRQMKTLSKMGLDQAIISIEHSIEQGYTGLFKPNAGKQTAEPFSGLQEAAAARAARGVTNDV